MTDSRLRQPGVARMIIGSVLLVAIAIALLAGSGASQQTVTSWAGAFDIDTSAEISAGSRLPVTVAADAPDETVIQLAVFAPLNTTLFEALLYDGQAEFTVSQRLTEHAGSLQLVARIGTQNSEPTEIRVLPLSAVDPVVPLVGPRTIIADGSDFTMTVVTPTDQFGNPLERGTPVTIEVLHPNGERSMIDKDVNGGLTSALIESTTETGRVTISSSVGDADGPSNTVDQVAGIPADFTVEVDSRNAIADGFALHEVRTSELRDRFGNLLPDGVSATFIVENTVGISLIHSVVQGSIARAVIEAPDEAGEITIWARVSGHESVPVEMSFSPAIESFPAVMTSDDAGTAIAIGPVLTSRGGYVPDGTVVIIRTSAAGEVIAEAALRSGIALLVFEQTLLSEGPLEAVLLGTTELVIDSEAGE